MQEPHERDPNALPAACERVQGRLAELVDHGLSPLEEARDHGHLEACPACAAEAELWTRLHADLGAALGGPSVAPQELVEQLAPRLAAVRIQPPPRERVALRPLQSLVAVAASLVLLFGLETLSVAMDAGEGPLLAPVGLEARLGGLGLDLPAGLIPGVDTGSAPLDLELDLESLLEVVR